MDFQKEKRMTPIVLTGSAIGSNLGQIFRMDKKTNAPFCLPDRYYEVLAIEYL